MTERMRRLTFIVLSVVIVYTILMVKVISKKTIVNPIVDPLFVFLTSIGFYQMLVDFLFRIVEGVPVFSKIYWGRLFVDGLWSYTYTLDGKDDSTIYFGVWRFEQNLYSTRVVGFGLTDKFTVRSRVRSMTDMISSGSMHEFVNIRSDSVDSAKETYSRTTMYFELNKNKLLRYPARMRGITIVYGGPLNGRICNNLFVKHESARTEQDVIQELRTNFLTYGAVHPEVSERGVPAVASPSEPARAIASSS